jgi:hypothetical protein
MGRIVIAAYRPKPDRSADLLALVGKHWRILDGQQLVSARPRIVMQAADGTVLEVFEWRSAQAIEQAHANPAVLALWESFEAVCEHVPLAGLAEAQGLFAEFEALPS